MPKRSTGVRLFLETELNFLKKYLRSASIDGIDHVTEGKSVLRRVFWALILIGSFVVCLFFLIQHGREYARSPTATSLKISRPTEGLPFPAVTVCNLNPVSRSYAQKMNISEFLQFYLRGSLGSRSMERCEEVIESFNLSMSSLTFDELYSDGASPKYDEFILSCNYAINYTNSIDCTSQLVPVITEYGSCFTFNGLSASNGLDTLVKVSGSQYGLQMIVNISQNDYIASQNNDAGILVVIHNRNVFPDLSRNGILVPPGRHTQMAITQRQIIDRTDSGSCRDNSAGISDVEYSIAQCRASALFDHISSPEGCGCVIHNSSAFLPQYSKSAVRRCSLKDTCCIVREKYIVESLLDCPPPCDLVTFTPTVSCSKFPYNRFADVLSAFYNTNDTLLEDNLVSFSIFFSDLYVENSEIVLSYTPQLLVADIGGTLGLFLGASIVSLLELFVLFYDEIKSICFIKNKATNKTEKQETAHQLQVSSSDTEEEDKPLQKDASAKEMITLEKPLQKDSNAKETTNPEKEKLNPVKCSQV